MGAPRGDTLNYKAVASSEDCALVGYRGDGKASVESLNCTMTLVYQQHHKSLLAFLNFKLRSPSEASDIAQEAYARVLRHGLPEDLKCARAYVFKTANNLAINRLIERQRKKEHLAVDPQDVHLPSEQPTPEEDAHCRDRLKVLQEAVEELPIKCRRAFVYYKFDFIEYKDIAKRMNLTESMIRKYVLRGIRHCRQRLEESLRDDIGSQP